MSWLGAAGQELDEPQQQALLRIVAAANQNAGADDSEEDDREVRCGLSIIRGVGCYQQHG